MLEILCYLNIILLHTYLVDNFLKRTTEIYRKNTEVILTVLKLIRSLEENEEIILNKS